MTTKSSFLFIVAGLVLLVPLVASAATYYLEEWEEGTVAGWAQGTYLSTLEVRNDGGHPNGYLYFYGDVGGLTGLSAVAEGVPDAKDDYGTIYEISLRRQASLGRTSSWNCLTWSSFLGCPLRRLERPLFPS